MVSKSERFEFRLDEGLLAQIDAWRADEPGMPSRADAVRQLVTHGLGRSRGETLVLSDGERLITSMLCDLMKASGIDGEYDADFIQTALYGGHLWSLKWKHAWLFHDGEDRYSAVKHVLDTLDMWRFIESAYARLPAKEKKALGATVPHRGENPKFTGYDGNNETMYVGIVRHMVDRMGLFNQFNGRDFDSHVPRVGRYAAMLRVFRPLRDHLHDGRELGLRELTDILLAN